jgi:hypothetical protein
LRRAEAEEARSQAEATAEAAAELARAGRTVC